MHRRLKRRPMKRVEQNKIFFIPERVTSVARYAVVLKKFNLKFNNLLSYFLWIAFNKLCKQTIKHQKLRNFLFNTTKFIQLKKPCSNSVV